MNYTEESVTLVNETEFSKLRVLTGDLLDLWVYEGEKGLKYAQESRLYKLTDPYMNYIHNFEQIKASSLLAQEYLIQKYDEVSSRVVVFLDDASKFVGILLKVAEER